MQLDPLAMPGPARDAVLAYLLADARDLAALRLVCQAWRAAVEGAAWEDGRLRIALRAGLPIEPLVSLFARERERVRAVSIGYPRGKEEQWRDLEDRGTAWVHVAPVRVHAVDPAAPGGGWNTWPGRGMAPLGPRKRSGWGLVA